PTNNIRPCRLYAAGDDEPARSSGAVHLAIGHDALRHSPVAGDDGGLRDHTVLPELCAWRMDIAHHRADHARELQHHAPAPERSCDGYFTGLRYRCRAY